MTLFDEDQQHPAPPIPAHPTLALLRDAAEGCQACHLYRDATQTVFGEGEAESRLMLVGEQPGDKEDRAGHPFVGPSGQLLDRALAEAGIDRSAVYVTNVVKHFKWTPRGKRRIHAKPNAEEIGACRPWLDTEIDVVRPQIVACLGATAAQALLGKQFRVTKERGRLQPMSIGDRTPLVTATVHPSSILRGSDESRAAEYAAFVADLEVVARALAG
ncbi:MAG: uracil-DNA glycosylase [Acidimicrobiaceae bacterium]|nr:uracil-DNA glycosylase [Acidimicrobiaceae bacterium]